MPGRRHGPPTHRSGLMTGGRPWACGPTRPPGGGIWVWSVYQADGQFSEII